MNRYKLLLAVIAMFAFGTMAQSQTILGGGTPNGRDVTTQTTNLTLTAGGDYLLRGLYFIADGVTLTIPAGTTIKAELAATLIISPGGKIEAVGTAGSPIVFTSAKPAGQKLPGDWGGVIILGKAPTNQVGPLIEGGIIPGSYGGTDPNDNSGHFQYVRIEYCGYRYQLNNEVNGLSMGGVGRGTTIDHVMVKYAADDSFEWFGGTVDAKYLIAYGGTDDEFDTDFGYSGRVQFALGVRDPNVWDPTGESNGFESDNSGSGLYDETPRTAPKFSNVTLIGPKREDGTTQVTGNRYQFGAVLRRSSETSLFNTVIFGYPGGITLRNPLTLDAMNSGLLKLQAVSLGAFEGSSSLAIMHGKDGITGAQTKTFFETAGQQNLGSTATREASALGYTVGALGTPNAVPAVGSEPDVAPVMFTELNAATGNWFTVTDYRGAFDPAVPMASSWASGAWVDFTPLSVQVVNTSHSANQWVLRSLPTMPADLASSSVFPGTVAGPWSYKTNTYALATTLEAGDGYWLYYGAGGSNAITGSPIASSSVELTVPAAGRWALIGPGTTAKPVANLTVTGPATITGTIWGWDGTNYVAATTLAAGQAYWVYLSAVGAGGTVTLAVNP